MKREKKGLAIVLSATMVLGCLGLTGCGSNASKDYDVYFYNAKSEIAESLEGVSSTYQEETGKTLKVFSCGTDEGMETLRSELSSINCPTVFSVNQSQIAEMIEGGYALDASEITNEELKSIYNEIPTALRLTADDETGNYGIPYNIEGYGLIANETILADIFGLENATQFETDYKATTYEEFETIVVAVNNYINGTGGESITLNGNTYTTATEKTDATSELNGVFAIAGAEKWTYGNHYSNYALNAVFPTFSATANATADEVSSLESVLTKSLEELEFLSQYTAGQNGAVSRGADYINSTITGYDQAVQTFAAGKAVFIKQGNWIYSTVAETDAAFAENLTMLPMKVNFDDSDVTAEGMSVEKMNASVPEFVSQYYIINAKATDEEIAAAEEFLLWLNTTETGSNIIINNFAFVPYNADDSVKLDNPLSNDLISYKNEENVLCNAFDAFPTAWGTDVFGAYIQENLFTTEGEWTDEQIQECVDTSINSWLESIN